MENDYGARIERGKVVSETEEGFVVESLDRDGVVSPPILTMDEIEVGDRVLFTLFDDGTGYILTAIPE